MWVAHLYIKSNREAERNRRFHEKIEETYIENGLIVVQSGMATYGNIIVFTMDELFTHVMRTLNLGSFDEVMPVLLEDIKNRTTISKILDRDFSLITPGIPSLLRFGPQLYFSIFRTLQFFANLLMDLLSLDGLKTNLERTSKEEFNRSGEAMMNIIQFTQQYLVTRIENLKNYIWQKDIKNYKEFQSIFDDEKYKKFLDEQLEYDNLLVNFTRSMRLHSGFDQKETSMAFSGFLTGNIDKNPFQ